MLVINGHWQDAACWEKGRMISGWSQIIPGSGLLEAGHPPWSQVTARPFPGWSQGLCSKSGLESVLVLRRTGRA